MFLFSIYLFVHAGSKIALVSNKIDLAYDIEIADGVSISRSYKKERLQAKRFAKENGMLYFETSAKDNIGINAMFGKYARLLTRDKTLGPTCKPLDATFESLSLRGVGSGYNFCSYLQKLFCFCAGS